MASDHDVDRLFEQAFDRHRGGDAAGAIPIYRKVLARAPEDTNVLYFLGLALGQTGEAEEAAGLMARALADDRAHASRHNNLGTLYQEIGRLDVAAAEFRLAIDIDSNLAEAHLNLGVLLQGDGDPGGAVACFRRAVAAKTDFFAAYNNLGAVLRELGRLDEAGVAAERAVRLNPRSAKAHNVLGIIHHEQEQLDAAFASFKRATELDSEFAEAYNNLGTVFRDQNQFDAASACFEKAVALDGDFGDAHNNLGTIRQRQGRLEDAMAGFRRALELDPEFPPVLANIATIYHRMNRQDDALAYCRRALAADEGYPEAHFNLSEVLLLLGEDLEEGWRQHGWRWKKKEFTKQWREGEVPVWDGSDPDGKRILVWGEQGIGEEIMYASLVPDLVAAGARVVLESEPRLVPLFARSFPEVSCRARSDPPAPIDTGEFDFHTPAGDMNLWYRPNFASFPDRAAFLRADETRSRDIRARYLENSDGPLIGISWFSRNPEMGWEKSIDLEDWQALLETPGATFVDLQYGDTRAARNAFAAATGIRILHDETIDQMTDLDAFAAQVAALDLVISISNTTVHTAGALGVPTWVLLSEVPLWRWFTDRDDSPWYSSVRLFRQPGRGQWANVLARVREHLVAYLAEGPHERS